MVFQVEAFRHAAIGAFAVLHAILERQAGEVTIELVGPLVIGTDKTAGIAVLVLAKAHATVGAAVFNHAYAGVCCAVFGRHAVTHHNHLPLADVAELVVASIGYLDVEANITPVRAVEDFFQLLLVELGVGVGPERDAA